MIAGRVDLDGVKPMVPEPDRRKVLHQPPVDVDRGDIAPALAHREYKGAMFPFAARIPPASGAELQPDGSAPLTAMKPDLSRLKEGVPYGLLPWL